MRIQIKGDSASAGVLRKYLASLAFELVERAPAYAVRIEDGGDENIVVEGVECALVQAATSAISELAGRPVEWRPLREGTGRELRVIANAAASDAVERGILRALLRVTGHGERMSWVGKLASMTLLKRRTI